MIQIMSPSGLAGMGMGKHFLSPFPRRDLFRSSGGGPGGRDRPRQEPDARSRRALARSPARNGLALWHGAGRPSGLPRARWTGLHSPRGDGDGEKIVPASGGGGRGIFLRVETGMGSHSPTGNSPLTSLVYGGVPGRLSKRMAATDGGVVEESTGEKQVSRGVEHRSDRPQTEQRRVRQE